MTMVPNWFVRQLSNKIQVNPQWMGVRWCPNPPSKKILHGKYKTMRIRKKILDSLKKFLGMPLPQWKPTSSNWKVSLIFISKKIQLSTITFSNLRFSKKNIVLNIIKYFKLLQVFSMFSPKNEQIQETTELVFSFNNLFPSFYASIYRNI